MTTKLAAGFRSRGTAGMMQGVHQGQSRLNRICRKLSGFSFAGPKSLSEILKVELFEDKTNSEMTDIWAKYHESKVIIELVSKIAWFSVLTFLNTLT